MLDYHQYPRANCAVSTPSMARRGSSLLCAHEVELSLEVDAEFERIVDIGCTSRGGAVHG